MHPPDRGNYRTHLRSSQEESIPAFFAYAWKKRATAASDANYSLHLWALASALMVFLNPSTRPHYFIFYVPAFCSLLQILALATEKAYLLLLLSVSTLLIAFTAEGVVGKQLNDKLEMWSVPTVGMLLLCVGLMVCLFIPVAKRNRKI